VTLRDVCFRRHSAAADVHNPVDSGVIQAITYCKDTYTITTANGQTRKFWERNLRLMTDASGDGPERNAPALVPAGMMGDRADVIFADPSEITSFIVNKC